MVNPRHARRHNPAGPHDVVVADRSSRSSREWEMPSFFQFTQGTESRARFNPDSSPLLGRFRAVPPRPGLGRNRSTGNQPGPFSSLRGSVHVGYGSILAAAGLGVGDDSDSDSDFEDELAALEGVGPVRRLWRRNVRKVFDLWVEPKQTAVKRVVDHWWGRYGALVVMPAILAVTWCAMPFPQYNLDDDNGRPTDPGSGSKIPGHGAARVRVNFWFFLFFFYGFYNLTALMWITKVFNLYSLNWWPQSLGFPLTVCLIAIVSIAVPIPIYLSPETRFLTIHNTAWISWTFIIMAMPVAIACIILLINERHLRLRYTLSETQRIFTTSWWTGEEDTISRRDRRRPQLQPDSFDPDLLHVTEQPTHRRRVPTIDRRWLPASFVRFVWFCLALFVGLMAYVIGEAYAEIYLRTLPHDNWETVVYVYSWVATIHILDGLTGWILGVREGERVGSYPLSWAFKLYFMLTYQTYVRALYARLRSPAQFITLQALSSAGLIIFYPTLMSPIFHRILTILGVSTLSYSSYQKLCVRNIFIRFIAENVSMATFLGSVLVLHFGVNKDVYPYFAFDDPNEPYDFNLTFYASSVTWACELAAALCVRIVIRWFFKLDVDLEGKLDLAVWPELLPTSAAVILHVLQNMLFSIIRLQFR
ncbi:Conserved fungal protein [Scedosporium apiospermum]|uniref:Conserved fungal protein n=1 Tax=Pseudallescheria apiosperma TaxID=563466 RepID=A0A084G4X2_PSEDA|nr:uncharacterized protein SAPIO_CDS5565 [Scedosporium apiospermum]KEZ42384.1 Conserved fungal protein [Scedosporium apiospermum]